LCGIGDFVLGREHPDQRSRLWEANWRDGACRAVEGGEDQDAPYNDGNSANKHEQDDVMHGASLHAQLIRQARLDLVPLVESFV
jgi:hypothetical protein